MENSVEMSEHQLSKPHGLAVVQNQKRIARVARHQAAFRRVDGFIAELERAVVDRDAGSGGCPRT
jgi:hypothetical protein